MLPIGNIMHAKERPEARSTRSGTSYDRVVSIEEESGAQHSGGRVRFMRIINVLWTML